MPRDHQPAPGSSSSTRPEVLDELAGRRSPVVLAECLPERLGELHRAAHFERRGRRDSAVWPASVACSSAHAIRSTGIRRWIGRPTRYRRYRASRRLPTHLLGPPLGAVSLDVLASHEQSSRAPWPSAPGDAHLAADSAHPLEGALVRQLRYSCSGIDRRRSQSAALAAGGCLLLCDCAMAMACMDRDGPLRPLSVAHSGLEASSTSS